MVSVNYPAEADTAPESDSWTSAGQGKLLMNGVVVGNIKDLPEERGTTASQIVCFIFYVVLTLYAQLITTAFLRLQLDY